MLKRVVTVHLPMLVYDKLWGSQPISPRVLEGLPVACMASLARSRAQSRDVARGHSLLRICDVLEAATSDAASPALAMRCAVWCCRNESSLPSSIQLEVVKSHHR
eukprot:6048922-Pleurochrysis_carterae.AAC.2